MLNFFLYGQVFQWTNINCTQELFFPPDVHDQTHAFWFCKSFEYLKLRYSLHAKSFIMIWFFIVLFFVLGLLLWLPIELQVDTENDVYRMQWRGIFGLRALPESTRWRFFFKVFFIEKEWRRDTVAAAAEKPEKPAPRKTNRKKSKPAIPVRRIWQLVKNMLRSIEVRRCHIALDTDDYPRNAILFPVFFLLSTGRRQLIINFNGEQVIQLHLQTRLYRVAGAFLRTFIHPKIA